MTTVEELRAATMGFDWRDLPDDALIPAVPLLRKAADLLEAALSERDAHSKEIERLRDCLRERPNTLLIAHEDGDHERLSRAVAKALDRAEAAEARVTALEKVLEPFARADRAIGDEPGPFRFETRKGHRLIEREDLRAARAELERRAPAKGGET